MIDVFIGLTGRTDATHAALLLTELKAAVGQPITLVRITVPGEARLPTRSGASVGIRVVERGVTTCARAVVAAVEEIQAASAGKRHVVLDLPRGCAFDATLLRVANTVLHTVGPSPFDEHVAALALADVPVHPDAGDTKARPAWLLGCGRGGGGPAAIAFARRMLGVATGNAPHVLPVVLPPLTRAETAELVSGSPSAPTLVIGSPLLGLLKAIRATPDIESVKPGHLVRTLADGIGIQGVPDERDLGDRLRDLGDTLHAIRDGLGPTTAELGDAPRLENWRVVTKTVRVITGHVTGHPNFHDGRRIVTSEVYASDERWARTLSRYYRLGRPAGAVAGAALH